MFFALIYSVLFNGNLNNERSRDIFNRYSYSHLDTGYYTLTSPARSLTVLQDNNNTIYLNGFIKNLNELLVRQVSLLSAIVISLIIFIFIFFSAKKASPLFLIIFFSVVLLHIALNSYFISHNTEEIHYFYSRLAG